MTAHLESALEDTIVEHLLAGGWVKGASSDFSCELGLDTAQLFTFLGATQIDEWDKLVGHYGSPDAAQRKFARRVADEITARGTVDVLRNGVKDLGCKFDLAFFEPAHDLTPELRELFERNVLSVTRQAAVSESKPLDTVDLLLCCNGIPVSTAELKTATTGQTVRHAIRQYQLDRNPKDLVFANRALVHFAVDANDVYMTTRLEGKGTRFLPFNQGSEGPGKQGGAGNPAPAPGKHRSAYLWELVWDRRNWLDLLGSFVHIEQLRDDTGKKTGTTVTLFPRYQQWDAVRTLLAATKTEGPGQNKLIQHSAGSGKSNTIAWLAHQLSRLHTHPTESLLGAGAKNAGLGPNQPVFDKVIVITDRVVLDRQLQDTIAGFDHAPGVVVKIDKHSDQLREALAGFNARIVITTLQKFPVVAREAAELTGTRFAVIVDEAHSSQSGEAAKDLKAVLSCVDPEEVLAASEQAEAREEDANKDVEDLLVDSVQYRGRQPNLTFFAFTATPKNKTLQLFGERPTESDGPYRPFHLYSMRQAIEEGFILDVLANYTTYSTYYRLANKLTGDDPELPKGKAAAALARWVSLHPSNIGQRAEIIVEHFRAHTATKVGGHAKAMVVTPSRLHAVRYFEAIRAYIDKHGYNTGANSLRALVAFSGTVIDPANPTVEYREPLLNGIREAELPKRFATDEFQVLVVAEKYQTGFDQPLLHTMYVAKKLKEVKAVQTLSRLNRIAPGKTDTFVLDFVNTEDEIREAFRPYYETTTATPTDPNLLYTLQRRILDANIIDPAEIYDAVEAVLAGGNGSSGKLNSAISPAAARWAEIIDEDEKEGFRTALRDYVRTYAFLGQIVPFADTDLEALYIYGKNLITLLHRDDTSGPVEVSDAVVLTHLRHELTLTQADLSLEAGEDVDSLDGPGTGQGKQNDEPLAPLSELIEALNERFNFDFTEADRIWFEQQEAYMREDDEVRVVALDNDFDQFKVWLSGQLEGKVLERQEANESLFKAFFDKPGFQELMLEAMAKSLYRGLRAAG